MREGDNLTTFMCRISWKSGNLDLLEPSGPHRASYGTALPLRLAEKSRHATLRSFRNYVIGSPNQYIKPNALIHIYDDETFS